MQKIFGIIGWIGTVLVFGAVAVRMFYPDVESVRDLRRVGGPGRRC